MPNYFFGNKKEDNIILGKDETAHLKVVKKEPGNIIDVITGDGYFYKAVIEKIGKKESILKITEKTKDESEYKPEISLYLGMSKWDRMRIIIEKSAELRVQKLFVFKGQKSHQNYKNLDKFYKYIIESMKQTGYSKTPHVEFIEFKKIPVKNSLVLDFEANNDFRESIIRLKKNINLIIGPDVGFSKDEKLFFANNNFSIISPGNTIMRFETAAIYTLSAINFINDRLI
ncbi:MAG: 16S rRNA (uracil(1498)-N(3))-methyltransferase [Thermotogota bacterium]